MASIEVSSKNKKNLEAGRRKLEEFRKKKAQSKNGKSKNQSSTDDATKYEKSTSENGPTSTADSFTTQNDDRSNTAPKSSSLPEHSDTSHISSRDYGSESVPHAFVDMRNDNFSGSGFLQNSSRQGENNLETPELNHQTDLNSSTSFSNTNVRSNDVAKAYTEGVVTNVSHHESEHTDLTTNFSPSGPKLGHSHLELKNHSSFGLDERNPTNSLGNLASFRSRRTSDSFLTSSNSIDGGLFNGPTTFSTPNESYTRKSRPSFLDSLNIKDSLVSGSSFVDNDNTVNSKLPSGNLAAKSAIHNPFIGSSYTDTLPVLASSNPSDDLFGNASKGHQSFEQRLESNLEYASHKQNDDFAALEQHIEDLTQEKFSLQRALEASKGLTESLAAENSSLTESYNQQASTVSQLKAEMERLQEEIKARLVELEAIKAEYMNAQLECNAADERAKLLASEVISLEEKALRLRSSELKLERELENSSAEIASYKKKISTLDKERRELLQTIDSLQEEKKVLQSKLRRASTNGISVDLNKGHTKKDASTSTNDLGLDTTRDNSGQTSASMEALDNFDNFQLLQNISANQENFASIIPPDQLQIIQNINSLISEISSEKEELMQALITEVSSSTKLKELNKELSHKLEVQTQRLELLTAQSMASQLVTPKPTASSEILHESVIYADEGDEVVERVLGWIMKMFPGGPSKRRTRRL